MWKRSSALSLSPPCCRSLLHTNVTVLVDVSRFDSRHRQNSHHSDCSVCFAANLSRTSSRPARRDRRRQCRTTSRWGKLPVIPTPASMSVLSALRACVSSGGQPRIEEDIVHLSHGVSLLRKSSTSSVAGAIARVATSTSTPSYSSSTRAPRPQSVRQGLHSGRRSDRTVRREEAAARIPEGWER